MPVPAADSVLAPVGDASFDTDVHAARGVVAVEFTADWCPPCRVLAPVLEAVARELAPRARVLVLDADTNPRTVARYAVRGLPSVLVFRDGTLVDRVVGAVPAATLRARLEAAIGG